MQEKTEKKRSTENEEGPPQVDLKSDQRKGERRKCVCEGYTYITMVGWMCRREQERRNNNDNGC